MAGVLLGYANAVFDHEFGEPSAVDEDDFYSSFQRSRRERLISFVALHDKGLGALEIGQRP